MGAGYYSYVQTNEAYIDETARATYKGIAIKTIILIGITIAVAFLTGYFLPVILTNNEYGFYITLIFSVFIGAISGIIGRFFPKAAKVCSIIYSLTEGIFLGTITAIVDYFAKGAGTLSIASTLVTFTIMLVLYAFGFLKNGAIIRTIIFGLIFAALGLSVFDLVFSLINGGFPMGIYILIQVILLIYGVITLAFNFAEAQYVVNVGASKSSEWCVALGMEISLIFI